MLEAARIDGASEAKILAQLVMPLSRPALMTVGIFAALGAWNDFLGPLIYLNREESKTLAVGLHSLTSQFSSEWGLLMAAGSLMIVPVLILFFFAQRYFIEGITLTGSKG
jgi:multiple sugar transport system permease protein